MVQHQCTFGFSPDVCWWSSLSLSFSRTGSIFFMWWGPAKQMEDSTPAATLPIYHSPLLQNQNLSARSGCANFDCPKCDKILLVSQILWTPPFVWMCISTVHACWFQCPPWHDLDYVQLFCNHWQVIIWRWNSKQQVYRTGGGWNWAKGGCDSFICKCTDIQA